MLRFFLLFGSVFLFGGALHAANTANATVTFTIGSVNEISLSGNPAALVVNAATAGNEPTSDVDNSTTYNITTNGSSLVITGELDSNMPAGVTLDIDLVAPTGATSSGSVSMSTTPQNLVTGVSNVAESGLGITYTLSATSVAAIQGPSNRTVTYTLGP